MQFLARHDAEDLQSQPSEAEMGVGRGSEVQSHSQPHSDGWQHEISSPENKTERIKMKSKKLQRGRHKVCPEPSWESSISPKRKLVTCGIQAYLGMFRKMRLGHKYSGGFQSRAGGSIAQLCFLQAEVMEVHSPDRHMPADSPKGKGPAFHLCETGPIVSISILSLATPLSSLNQETKESRS